MAKEGIRVEFESFRNFLDTYSDRISPAGLFVATDQPLEPGTALGLEFSLKDGFQLLRGVGEVVWNGSMTPEGEVGMAVRFSELDDPSRQLIAKINEQVVEKGGAVFDVDTQPASAYAGSIALDSDPMETEEPATWESFDSDEAEIEAMEVVDLRTSTEDPVLLDPLVSETARPQVDDLVSAVESPADEIEPVVDDLLGDLPIESESAPEVPSSEIPSPEVPAFDFSAPEVPTPELSTPDSTVSELADASELEGDVEGAGDATAGALFPLEEDALPDDAALDLDSAGSSFRAQPVDRSLDLDGGVDLGGSIDLDADGAASLDLDEDGSADATVAELFGDAPDEVTDEVPSETLAGISDELALQEPELLEPDKPAAPPEGDPWVDAATREVDLSSVLDAPSESIETPELDAEASTPSSLAANVLDDTLLDDTLPDDALRGDTLQGDTLQGDTLQDDTLTSTLDVEPEVEGDSAFTEALDAPVVTETLEEISGATAEQPGEPATPFEIPAWGADSLGDPADAEAVAEAAAEAPVATPAIDPIPYEPGIETQRAFGPKRRSWTPLLLLGGLVLAAAAFFGLRLLGDRAEEEVIAERPETTAIDASAEAGGDDVGAASAEPTEVEESSEGSGAAESEAAAGGAPDNPEADSPETGSSEIPDSVTDRSDTGGPGTGSAPATTREATRAETAEPKTVPAADPSPPAATLPIPGSRFTVRDVTWRETDRGTLVTVWTDTTLESGDFQTFDVAGGAPRVVVKLIGVGARYAQQELAVGTDEVDRLRFGFHGDETPAEIHVVADLAGADVSVVGTENRGKSVEILFGR